jgi:hypothetical protein
MSTEDTSGSPASATPGAAAAATSPDKVGEILREFVEEKTRELEDERRRNRPTGGGRRFRLAAVTVACAATWVGPSLLAVEPAAPAEAVVREGIRTNLFLAGQTLSSYRDEHGGLPRQLQQAGVDDSSLTYLRRSDSTFALTTMFNGHELAFDSDTDPATYLATPLPLGGSR